MSIGRLKTFPWQKKKVPHAEGVHQYKEYHYTMQSVVQAVNAWIYGKVTIFCIKLWNFVPWLDTFCLTDL